MSKKTAAAIAAMLAGGDGVTVAKNGANYEIGFGFSASMVSKMKTVDGAKFEQGMWAVPESSADQLVDAVADMRDFVRSNGVQVKTMENGGVKVLFDYNKEMTQVLGKVDGAKFDKEAYAWTVPANSKSLADPLPKFAVSLDKAVNTMRGIAIESAKELDNIKELAAATAQSRGMKPGIHFPDKDHSYTGQIVNVNGGYAAQLSGTNEKDGVAFLTIHKLSDLGKAVFKGDNMRIDYDENRHANVRTTEVFQQQQKEREQLTNLAAQKMDNANVRHASTKDDAKHLGSVVEVTDHFVLQHCGKNDFKIHNREALNVASIVKNQNLEIAYKGGKGMVADRNQEKQREGLAH